MTLLHMIWRLIPTIDIIAAILFPLSDDWLSAISYLQREPHGDGYATFFCLKLLITVLQFKRQVPFTRKLKKNTQLSNITLISIDCYYFFLPILVSLNSPFNIVTCLSNVRCAPDIWHLSRSLKSCTFVS